MWSRIVDRGTPSCDDRFIVDFIGERSIEAATTAHFSKRVFSPTPQHVFNTSQERTLIFPNPAVQLFVVPY